MLRIKCENGVTSNASVILIVIDNLIVHYAIDDATNEITIVTEAVRFDHNLASYFQIVSTTLAQG